MQDQWLVLLLSCLLLQGIPSCRTYCSIGALQTCSHVPTILQDPNARPSFKEIKARLVAFSQATFHCTAAEALARKRASEKRLIDQMLPQKVSHWLHVALR